MVDWALHIKNHTGDWDLNIKNHMANWALNVKNQSDWFCIKMGSGVSHLINY